LLDDALQIFTNLHVPESKNGQTPRFQPGIASAVGGGTMGTIMLVAVDFHCDAERRATKVENVRANRMLAAKACTFDLRRSEL
jgi:hypothetical protein